MSENPILERAERFLAALPHCQILGLQIRHADAHGLTLTLPYNPNLVGDPQSGVIHGGALSSLMDSACGISTVCALAEFEACPTLDLRIDHMHSAEPFKPIHGFAECYRITPTIIFVRGYAYQDDPASPLAHVVATFMRLGPLQSGRLAREVEGGQP